MDGFLTLGLVSLLLANASAYAITPTIEAASPYHDIVSRNVFGLKVPPPIEVKLPPPPELPKLKLQGISTILGRKQVLVKLLPMPPIRPKEESLILNEGEGKDGIEVVSIDEVNELVSFRIAGSPVTLSMKDDADRPVAGPAPNGAPPIPQPATQPAMVNPQGRPQPPLSREAQDLMLEVNRQKLLDEGNPRAKLLPRTGLRSEERSAN